MKRHNDENIRDIPKPDFSNWNRAVAVRPVCKSVIAEKQENKEFVRRICATTSSRAIFGFVNVRDVDLNAVAFITDIRDSQDFKNLLIVSKNAIKDFIVASNLSELCTSYVMSELFGAKYRPLISLYLSKIDVPLHVVYKEMYQLKPMQLFVNVCEFIDKNTVKSENQDPKRRRLFNGSDDFIKPMSLINFE